MAKKTKKPRKTRDKPGPKGERLIITEDPHVALSRLLRMQKKGHHETE
jgi:hypothetical protein